MSLSFFDTHCHIYPEDNLERIFNNCKKESVNYLNIISCNLKEAKNNLELTKNYKEISLSIGLHPLSVEKDFCLPDSFLSLMSEKIVAIGEIGLDYHYDNHNKNKQKEVFDNFLSFAKDLKLPTIIHSRDSFEDTYEILKTTLKKEHPFILHCFTGNTKWAKSFLNLGGYISYSGIISFKNANEIRESIQHVPLDRILIETDAPYLSPVPFRGRRNEPSFLPKVFDALADILSIEKLELAYKLLENSFKIFKTYKYGKNN